MNNLATPQPPVGIAYVENLNFHTNLVGLSMQRSGSQVAGKMDIRPLGRESWRGMKPSKPLPRSRGESRLLFQLPPSASFGALTILDVSRWQFELPALDRVSIVPYHHKLIPIENRDDD